MAEEAKREQETPEFPYRVASPEFFFLLQRIDRLDEKLTAEIASLRQELRAAEAGLRREVTEMRDKLEGTLHRVIGLVVAALTLTAAVALKVLL